jgi:biotin transporter BioY
MSPSIYFYAFLIAPVILWLANQILLRGRIHWLVLWLMATVASYIILLIGVYSLDSQLEAELYQHDQNGDRTFSGAEDTPEMREAMERFTNDTGRALAPFTGVPFSIFWVCLNYIPLGLLSLVIWRLRSRRGAFDSDDRVLVNVDIDAKSVDNHLNPYHPPRTKHRLG